MCNKCVFLLVVTFLFTTCCQAELVDPTQPANFNATTIATTLGKDLALTAIFYTPAIQTAIINGQTLEQGDTIATFQLIEIKPQAVILKGPAGIFELPLQTLFIKKPAIDGADTQ